jgi:hypothetical protein
MIISTAMCRRLGLEQYALWVCEQNGVEHAAECPVSSHSAIIAWVRERLAVPEEPVVEEVEVVEQPAEEVVTEEVTPFPSTLAYDAMTVAELRELCKERGLPVYGTKAEIVLRLRQHDNGIEVEEDETEGPAEEAAPEVESDAPAEEEAAAPIGDELNDTSSDGQEPVVEDE